MIYAIPGSKFQTTIDNAPAGMVGTMGVRLIRDSDGVTVTPRTTANIIELVPGSGAYRASLTAPEAHGSYTLFWDNGEVNPAHTATEDLVIQAVAPGEEAVPNSNIEPSVQLVADLLKSRTRNGATGMLEGNFNANTKPTAVEVTEEIADATSDVITDIGTEEIPVGARRQVKSLIALAAAMKVELSYYTEQVETNKSPYKLLEKQYERRLKITITAVERALEGDTEDTTVELLPHYSFPDGTNPQGMVGWGTVWN